MAGPQQLQAWIASLVIIFTLVVFVAIAGALLFWGFVVLRAWRGEKRKARQWRQYEQKRRDTPPMAQGLCDRCGKSFPKVYHLPDRRRLCPKCYTAEHG